MAIIIFFLVHWFMTLFVQTMFLHRYASHKMFTMNAFWEKFFHFFTYISQGSSYLVPSAYAVLHRMHHTYSDTDKDPHSPIFYKDVIDMMKNTRDVYQGIVNNTIDISNKFFGNYPVWKMLDKFGDSWISRLLWAMFYVSYYVYFANSAWYWYLLLPVHFLMGPVHGAIVNWCGHKYGYRNYNSEDNSKNTLALDFLMMGELFQNNHHKHPNSSNFAVKWWEFDPTYPILKVLHWAKIIKLRRPNG